MQSIINTFYPREGSLKNVPIHRPTDTGDPPVVTTDLDKLELVVTNPFQGETTIEVA